MCGTEEKNLAAKMNRGHHEQKNVIMKKTHQQPGHLFFGRYKCPSNKYAWNDASSVNNDAKETVRLY